MILRSVFFGLLAASLQRGLYFSLVSIIPSVQFAVDQFFSFWYYILSLASGFGLQIGLFVYLRGAIKHKEAASGKLLAATGATSTLANILPIIGISGVVSFVGQYQARIFWVGLAFNLLGLIYISRKVYKFHREAP